MSKIVQAVNAMITNADWITPVIKNGDEIFFVYRGKFKWSISKRDGEHLLWYYPGDESIESLSSYDGHDWVDTPMVTYRDSEIGTREAKASFAELYTLVKERLYGVNNVLDDIISDAEPF